MTSSHPSTAHTPPALTDACAPGQAQQGGGGSDFVDHYARYARESAQLMQQISLKAPQLASVLEQLNEGCMRRHIELEADLEAAAHPVTPQTAPVPAVRRGARRESLLDTLTGFCSHAFPGVAPLFHGCRAFLQLKMIKNNRQA